MKKIITITVTLVFGVAITLSAQQNSSSLKAAGAKDVQATNPNIERMRIVNEKMTAEKAARPSTSHKAAPLQQNPEEIARMKAAHSAASRKEAQPSGK